MLLSKLKILSQHRIYRVDEKINFDKIKSIKNEKLIKKNLNLNENVKKEKKRENYFQNYFNIII